MSALRRIAWIEPGRLPYGWPDQNVYRGILLPRAGPRMAGLLDPMGYDTHIFGDEMTPIAVDAIAENFDAVCLSLLSNTAPHGLILGRLFAERGLPVVAGGYHFAHTQMTPETLALTDEALDYVPYVIRGEGYRSLPMLLEALQGGRPLDSVPGLSYRRGLEKLHLPPAPLMSQEEISELPLPRWEKVHNLGRMRFLPVHGMLGCPRQCSWCAVWPRDGRRNRNTDPRRVVDEMQQGLETSDFCHVFMTADNFPAIHTWARQVCEEILRRKIRISWTCQAEVGAARRHDLVSLMRKAGCTRWCLGLESISDASLQDSQKRQTRADMEEGIRLLHAQGIAIHGMFICGLPHDTWASLRDTVRWAKRMRIETVQFLCLTDLPGSQDYETGRLWERVFRPFSGAYSLLNWIFANGHYVRMETPHLTFAQVQEACLRSMKEFYNLGHILRVLGPNRAHYQAERAEGKGRWQSFRQAMEHNWTSALIRARGFSLIRSWERSPFNRLYCQMLEMPERIPEMQERMLSLLPAEWIEVLERVQQEKEAVKDRLVSRIVEARLSARGELEPAVG